MGPDTCLGEDKSLPPITKASQQIHPYLGFSLQQKTIRWFLVWQKSKRLNSFLWTSW